MEDYIETDFETYKRPYFIYLMAYRMILLNNTYYLLAFFPFKFTYCFFFNCGAFEEKGYG